MDLLKTQLNRIQQQLGVLSASQKMLTGLLAVIMVATLVWWARYAADPEMEPVLNQSLNPDDIAQITSHLQSRDIHYKVVGDKVLVPVDRKMEVLADLGYSQMLPRDIKTGFDDIVKQSSPWDSPDKTEQLFLEAKQKTLGMVIRDFPGVAT